MSTLSALLIAPITFMCFSYANAGHHHGGGHSNIFRKQHTGWNHANYEFAYDIHDPWHNKNFRKEKGHFTKKGGHVEGSYGIHDNKGRLRIVKYTAGKGGFVASIKTNEPGTSNEDSAGAFYNGKDHDHGKWLYDVKTHHDAWGHKHHGHHGWKHHDHGHHGHHHGWKHHGHHGKHHHGYHAAASENLSDKQPEIEVRKIEEKIENDENEKNQPEVTTLINNLPDIGTRRVVIIDQSPSPNEEYQRIASYLPSISDNHQFDRYFYN